MTDLAALRRQRDELNQQIAAGEREARRTWNDGLEALQNALRQLASVRNEDLRTSVRKNVRTLAIRNVDVHLGFIQEEYGPYLAVDEGSRKISFSGVVPSPGVMTALVNALLEETVTPAS